MRKGQEHIRYGPEIVQKGLNNLKSNIDKKGLKQYEIWMRKGLGKILNMDQKGLANLKLNPEQKGL